MKEVLSAYLPIMVNILLCVLIVFLIIICIKIIKTMNKLETIVDDVDRKVQSLNGVFRIVDGVTDKLSELTEVISDSIILFFRGLFKRKKKNKKEEEEENYDE